MTDFAGHSKIAGWGIGILVCVSGIASSRKWKIREHPPDERRIRQKNVGQKNKRNKDGVSYFPVLDFFV